MLNPPFLRGFSRSVRGGGEATRGGTLYYPIWLSYATGLLEESYEVQLVDSQARHWTIRNVLRSVLDLCPDMVVIDTNFSSLENDLSVARALKSVTDVTVVLVGPPASVFSESILDKGCVDIVAKYEYDYTLLEVAETLRHHRSLREIRGISYRDNGKIINNPDRGFTSSEDLDEIPFVSEVYQKHLNIRDYFLSSSLYPMVQIFTGRGCPYQCAFCSWPQTLMGRKYRVRSVSSVLDEFEYIADTLPSVKEVFIEDDTFTIDKRRVLDFCREYRKRGVDIVWSCNARLDTLNFETMKEMKKANCRLLIVGFESGSNRILRNIKKGFTTRQARSFAGSARRAGLLVHGDFMIGLPGETEQTIEETRRLIEEVRPDILQVLVATPIPGTEFYRWCDENDYMLTKDPNEYLDQTGHQKSIVTFPNLSSEEMTRIADEMLRTYYLSIEYIPLALRQILRKHGLDELRRLFHSATMLTKYLRERRP